MFITGPGVIKSVTGEEVTADDLGGADAHMSTSGNIHFVAEDDDAAVLIAQKLLSFLPQNNTEDAQISTPMTMSPRSLSCATSFRWMVRRATTSATSSPRSSTGATT